MKAKALKTKVGSSPRGGILHFPATPGVGVRETAGHIFRSNLNNNFKLTPFNNRFNDNGQVRYLPPVSKE